MEIKHIYLIKALHEALAHPSECGVIQIAMVSDKSEYAIACSFDPPLGKADKLYIVISKPFGIGSPRGLSSTSK